MTRMNGETWSVEVGQSLSCPRTSCFPPPPTKVIVYMNSHSKKLQVFFQSTKRRERLHLQWVTSENVGHLAPLLQDYCKTKCDTYSKSMLTNTKHGHPPVDTNSPTPSMYSGALQIPCNSSNCTFWGFTILTSYVSATGLCRRDQLKWKGPTCPSCYDPPRCGHRSGCPSSRCDPWEGIMRLQ